MNNAVGVTRLGHVNIVVPDHNAAVQHWRRLFDAEFFLFMYAAEQATANNLALVGATCIELFAPWEPQSMLGRTLARRGPGPFSLQFTVQDYDQAERACAGRGLRVTQAEHGAYFWVHPADVGGVSLEFSPAHFRDDPRDAPGWSAERWAKGPLGVTGLRSVTLNVTDRAEVIAGRFRELLGAEVVGAGLVDGRDFTEVRIAGEAYRLLSPSAGGPARGGVASIDFAVADLADVRRWARTVGVPVVTVDEGRLALPEQLNLGARVEFVQG